MIVQLRGNLAFKACAWRQHFARFGERGGRTLQVAKFELIRQVTHDLLLFYLIEFMNM